MEKIVLIGSNIAHSRSPRLHNHLFPRFDLPYRYELMPLEADEVIPAIKRMKEGGYRGANVTSPHKERVVAAMDRLSDEAETIGAVNAITFERGEAVGYNTDAYAVQRSLHEHGITAGSFTAAVLGTGGAARAAVHALLAGPTLRHLSLYSRSLDRTGREAVRWGDDRIERGQLDSFVPADLVIHATPVGLPGNEGSVLSEEQLRGVRILFEMIYSPAETELVRRARLAGAEILPGMMMFLHQALRSFELWTGIAPALDDIPKNLFDHDDTA